MLDFELLDFELLDFELLDFELLDFELLDFELPNRNVKWWQEARAGEKGSFTVYCNTHTGNNNPHLCNHNRCSTIAHSHRPANTAYVGRPISILPIHIAH